MYRLRESLNSHEHTHAERIFDASTSSNQQNNKSYKEFKSNINEEKNICPSTEEATLRGIIIVTV